MATSYGTIEDTGILRVGQYLRDNEEWKKISNKQTLMQQDVFRIEAEVIKKRRSIVFKKHKAQSLRTTARTQRSNSFLRPPSGPHSRTASNDADTQMTAGDLLNEHSTLRYRRGSHVNVPVIGSSSSGAYNINDNNNTAAAEDVWNYNTETEDANVNDVRQMNNTLGLAFSGGGIRSASFQCGALNALANTEDSLLDRVDYLSCVSGGGYTGSSYITYFNQRSLKTARDRMHALSATMKRNVDYLFVDGNIDFVLSIIGAVSANFILLIMISFLLADTIEYVLPNIKQIVDDKAPDKLFEISRYLLYFGALGVLLFSMLKIVYGWLTYRHQMLFHVTGFRKFKLTSSSQKWQFVERLRKIGIVIEYVVILLLKIAISSIVLWETMVALMFALEYTYRYLPWTDEIQLYGVVQVLSFILHLVGHLASLASTVGEGSNDGQKLVLLISAVMGPFSMLLLVARICVWKIFNRPIGDIPNSWFDMCQLVSFIAGIVVQFFYSGHESAMHDFYRRKLYNAFYCQKKDMKFWRAPVEAPFLISNSTLNKYGDDEFSEFMISPVFYGSSKTGYAVTKRLFGYGFLSNAMGVSGAALATVMGRVKVNVIWQWSLAMFSIGLGQWFPFRSGVYSSGYVYKFAFLVVNLIFLHAPNGLFFAMLYAREVGYIQQQLFWTAIGIVAFCYGLSLFDMPLSYMLMFNPLVRLFHQLFGISYKRGKKTKMEIKKQMRLRSTFEPQLYQSVVPFVYLSDGAHFENLGVYELLRRRCQLIVVSDAGSDDTRAMHCIHYVMQRARENLDCDFEFDEGFGVSDLQRLYFNGKEDRLRQSRKRYVRMTVKYYDVEYIPKASRSDNTTTSTDSSNNSNSNSNALHNRTTSLSVAPSTDMLAEADIHNIPDAEPSSTLSSRTNQHQRQQQPTPHSNKVRRRLVRTGTLWYLKPTLVGNEHPEIQLYALKERAFPHDSTAKQSNTEDFFKAYSMLGETTMKEIIADVRSHLTAANPHNNSMGGAPPLESYRL